MEMEDHGRVRIADLAPGERYFGVHSSTGRCVYRTRSEAEAREIADRNPNRLDVSAHVRPSSDFFVRDPEAWQAVAAEGRKYR